MEEGPLHTLALGPPAGRHLCGHLWVAGWFRKSRGGLRRESQLPGAGRGDVGGPLLSLHTCSLVGFLGGSAAEYLPATVEAQVQSLGWVEPLGK